jgi:apolipoprotein N-acyltransferase
MLRQLKKTSLLKDFLLSLLSGLLISFSFPDFNLEFLAWIGFVPLFFALKNKPKFKSFLLSYSCGIVFWSVTVYWLIHVTLLGTVLLVLYLSLYFGLFGLLLSAIDYRPSALRILFIPSLWVLLEYSRSHLLTGFPWALLGYSQYLNLPIIQIADIAGVWLVSFLVSAVNAGVYSAFADESGFAGRIKKFSVAALCLAIAVFYGSLKLKEISKGKADGTLKVSVVQANIPQDLKWDPQARGFIVKKYLEVSSKAAKEKPDLVIWPEASIPEILGQGSLYYEIAAKFSKENSLFLLLGAVTVRDSTYYNSALLISPDGESDKTYDKLHLVPFGEYIPLKNTFRFLETVVPIGDIAAGKDYVVFDGPALKGPGHSIQSRFSVLICFEDVFPELARGFVRKGAGFLVNITNDAWYKKTSAAAQHFQASVFRAVENRVFLVRCANTGISGFVSPSGKIISTVEDSQGENIFIEGVKTETIQPRHKFFSFYTKSGDFLILICLVVVLYGIIAPLFKKR